MDWSDWKAYCRRCLAGSYCQVQPCAWQNPANRRRSSGRSFTRSMSALQARDGSANWGCLRRHCSRHYWSTTAARDLRYIQIHSEQFFFHETIFFRDYMSTRQPSAKQKEIISLIVCFYTYFIFVADAADIVRGESFFMWRNFRYREILEVEKG